MKRTHVFTNEQLTDALKRDTLGGKYFVKDKNEQSRAYACASCAGRQLAMRKFRDGWKATVIE